MVYEQLATIKYRASRIGRFRTSLLVMPPAVMAGATRLGNLATQVCRRLMMLWFSSML